MSSEIDGTQNPKHTEGKKKRQLQLVPMTIMEAMAGPFALGASKYGPYNWRVKGVDDMDYIGACQRHISAYLSGEVCDPETGECHLHGALASLGIIIDARAYGKLRELRGTGMYQQWVGAKEQEKKEGEVK